MMSIEDPERCELLKEKVLRNDTELDEEWAKGLIPMDEIKTYPGSIKGPDPEDDPETYSRWFVEN